MITTVCAFQVASIPAASSDRMARIGIVGIVGIVLWTGDIIQIAKAGDLRRISSTSDKLQ
jgi:hypothetical protein